MVRSRGALHHPPPMTRATITSAPAPRRRVLICACRWAISFLKRLIACPFGWSRSPSARSAHGRPPSRPSADGAWRCATASCRYSHVSGRPRLRRRRMPPPTNTPRATPRTTNVGAMAIVRNTQDSGAPTSRPAAPDRPQQIHSSSAVRPRTTTGWRLSRCGRNVTVPSARTCCCSDIPASPYRMPVASVSSQIPITSSTAPMATVRPNWPQVLRPVWISA